MSEYPEAIDEFRTTQNLPGILYDETDTTTVYAEDSNNANSAIVAIETELGTNPSGASVTVGGRLDALDTTVAGKENSLGYTPENAANKSTSTSLGTSNTLYPTQNAVKTYVDTGLSTKQNSLGYTAENSANKSSSTSLGTSNTLYPTQNAVKSYIDAAITAAKSAMMPVGTIYGNSSVSTNPGTLLGFGTWVAYSEGRVIAGKAASGTFATAGATMGAETHTLSIGEMPGHYHSLGLGIDAIGTGSWSRTVDTRNTTTTGAANTMNTTTTGGGGAHNNIQPTKVAYLWERIA